MEPVHDPMSDISGYLVELARRCAGAYIAHPAARAALVTGSAAEGVSDLYSDIDMMVYYEALPSDEELDLARQANGGGERFWQLGDRAEGSIMEAYLLAGVECQIVHTTIVAWEREMAVVLENLEVESPLQKALSGILKGIPLYGEEWIARWKAQVADYPEALRDKMITHYLNFFPVWAMGDRFFARDAHLWFHQVRVETVQHLLGVLAGLNRVYYTTFQFKHMERFIQQLILAPENLTARIEALLAAEPLAAAALLESLVHEVVALVEREMPHIDTAPTRRRISRVYTPWKMPEQ